MTTNTITQLSDPLGFSPDPLTDLLRSGAQRLIEQAIEAETRTEAKAAFDFFTATYGVKYDKAVGKLTKDREVLLAFYDFPAEHWKHLRHCPSSHWENQGMSQPKDGTRHGLQTDDVCAIKVAQTQRCQPHA